MLTLWRIVKSRYQPHRADDTGFVALLLLVNDAKPLFFVQRHDQIRKGLVGDGGPELPVAVTVEKRLLQIDTFSLSVSESSPNVTVPSTFTCL